MRITQKHYGTKFMLIQETIWLWKYKTSENCTCLLCHEIQSLQWTQNQCTVYPAVALRKVNDEIKEDHFVVISDDVKFVELANSKIDEYYNQKGIVFENEI